MIIVSYGWDSRSSYALQLVWQIDASTVQHSKGFIPPSVKDPSQTQIDVAQIYIFVF